MPYDITHRKGSKIYKIVNQSTGKVVGTSTSREKAARSIVHRMEGEAKNPKKFKRVKDNKMRDYGDTDWNKRVIRVNKSKKKNKKRGDIINTIVHEERHVKHPKEHEKTVRKKTKLSVKRMNSKTKKRAYGRYK